MRILARKTRKMENNVREFWGNVGGYCRISVFDDKAGISIENQAEIIENYYQKMQKSSQVYNKLFLYEDIGISGRSFDRIGFCKMLSDIEKGLISCVIVKDFSRLCRNSYEGLDYIFNFFLKKNIRLIAIDDMFDSNTYRGNLDEYIRVVLVCLVNALYAKDISKKVKASYKLKKSLGAYIGGVVPYGFQPLYMNKGKLCIDNESIKIIKYIFALHNCGMSNKMIADKLNFDRILPPREYYRKKYNNQPILSDKKWHKSSVQRILNNPLYTEYIDIN